MRVDEIPVVVVAFKRPELLAHALQCIRGAGFRNLHAFVDAPRGPDDEDGVARCLELFRAVDWAGIEIVQRPANVGNATNVTDSVNRVFEHSDRLVLIEDDIFVHPAFGRFVTEALEHYADEPRVATVTGLRIPFSRRCFAHYPYDAFTLQRYSSWGTGLWRRAWETFDFDKDSLRERLRESDIPFERAGLDIVPMIRGAFFTGRMPDQYGVSVCANLILNDQLTVTPTWNMVLHEGYEDTATHAKAPGVWMRKLRWETEFEPDLAALRFPPVEPDPRVLKAYLRDRENPGGWTLRRFVPRPAREALRTIRGTRKVVP